MLPDRYCQLLTAYLDGALSPRERQIVDKLLEKSAEARKLLKDLEADAARLRRLPRHTLEPVFAADVLDEIQARGLRCDPATPVPSAVRRGGAGVREWPAWAGIVVAAAVLLMVTIG